MRHFARTTKRRLIAEGVETAAEAATLTELDIRLGQGYRFGRPAPLPDR
jgi:EAL domain-containing protein (putative c-di-GMP-specific phosphodiesterase class I)